MPLSLIISPRAGLANRLRVIASGAIMAQHTGRRFYVNWDPADNCNAAWSDLFQNAFERYDGPVDIHQPVERGEGFRRFAGDFSRFASPGPSDIDKLDEPTVAVLTHSTFKPAGMSRRVFGLARQAFYRSLQPVEAVREAVETVVQTHFAGHRVVGVHIRRTDHATTLGRAPHAVSPTWLFEAAMRLSSLRSGTRFFLATDDPAAQRRIVARFGARVVTYPKTSLDRSDRQSIRDALVDWLLLSRCDRMLATPLSSFSEEAAVKGGITPRIVRIPWR